MSNWLQPEPHDWWQIVDDAMQEDIGSGDITSNCLAPEARVDWYVEAQADGIVCGVGISEYLLGALPGSEDTFKAFVKDGDQIRRNDKIIEGNSNARRALMTERTLLNFLMHLSGIATLTSQFVEKTTGTKARILDTRKTIPSLRMLAKYAVRCGGGHNHRMGLYDGVLIKDNHIMAAGSITAAVERIREYAPNMVKFEVECNSMDMVEEAVECGVDIVMLDNMDPFLMRECVKRFEGDVLFEASGGVNLDTVRGVAQTGVDYISVGAITHSAPSLALHMELK